MPYIKKDLRKPIDKVISNLDIFSLDEGCLNYLITSIFKKYIEVHGKNYSNYNTLLGVLTSVQHELYRREVSYYEDFKIEENGDV